MYNLAYKLAWERVSLFFLNSTSTYSAHLLLQNSKSNLVFNTPTVSEICHFCKQKVYLMEKITAEGLVLHRACLKCHHCHTSLRLGGYAFDRDNPQGLFYCTQHYRLPAKVMRPTPKKSLSRQKMRSEIDSSSKIESTPERIRLEGIANLDLLNRGLAYSANKFISTFYTISLFN